jgi:hypothetical protein
MFSFSKYCRSAIIVDERRKKEPVEQDGFEHLHHQHKIQEEKLKLKSD